MTDSVAANPPAPQALTIDELRARLDAISAQGGGHLKVVLPFDPGHATMGGKPTQPITAAHVGFDWDAGKVLLDTPARLGVIDAELRKKLSRLENAVGHLLLQARRLGEDTLFPLEKQVENFKEHVELTLKRAHQAPTAPAPAVTPSKPSRPARPYTGGHKH